MRNATAIALTWLAGTAALSWATLSWFVPMLLGVYTVGYSVQWEVSVALACGLFVAFVMVVLRRRRLR